MRRFLGPTAAAALLAVLVVTGRAQQTSPPPPADQPQNPPAGETTPPGQTPVFRTGINFVRVDVIVTDRSGREVADLKQNDFDVLEDGKPQTVEAFKLVHLDGGTAPSAE